MTIYILSENHEETSKWLDDKSLHRMIKDVAQVLCNVHWFIEDKIDRECPGCEYGHESECERNCKLWPIIPLSYSAIDHHYKWSQWARECRANYLWLVDLLYHCLMEYRLRISGHKMYKVLCFARDNVPDLPEKPMDIKSKEVIRDIYGLYSTTFPFVMPKKYITVDDFIIPPMRCGNPFLSYRNYYQAKLQKYLKNTAFEKRHNIKHGRCVNWTRREKPEWLNL